MRWLGLLLVMVYFLHVYMLPLRSLGLCDLCLFFLLMVFRFVLWRLVIERQRFLFLVGSSTLAVSVCVGLFLI